MNDSLDDLLRQIKELENRVTEEIQKKQKTLKYKILRKRVIFEKEVQDFHKKYSISLPRYLIRANLLSYFISPVIYSMIIPGVILDIFLTVYQLICFPVYRVPLVKRKDYIIIDRQYLKYLNYLERLNCMYCGYFNGLISYAGEIAAVTEQYWCPIKHARQSKNHHSYYSSFMDYGDGENYRKGLERLRKELQKKIGSDSAGQKNIKNQKVKKKV